MGKGFDRTRSGSFSCWVKAWCWIWYFRYPSPVPPNKTRFKGHCINQSLSLRLVDKLKCAASCAKTNRPSCLVPMTMIPRSTVSRLVQLATNNQVQRIIPQQWATISTPRKLDFVLRNSISELEKKELGFWSVIGLLCLVKLIPFSLAYYLCPQFRNRKNSSIWENVTDKSFNSNLASILVIEIFIGERQQLEQ